MRCFAEVGSDGSVQKINVLKGVDPAGNRVVVMDLTDNGALFSANRREIHSTIFDRPMDLAPAAACSNSPGAGLFNSIGLCELSHAIATWTRHAAAAEPILGSTDT